VTTDNGGRQFSATSVDSPLPDNNDVLRDATMREVLQAVFLASPLGGYISRPSNAESMSVGNEFVCELVQCQRRLVRCSQISK
jgi:hypothetical protein